ncbi:MAG: sodium-dependent transporter [Chloroflexi bacterium]|nr:sodium-dependent transporter [Chloroflexota bacterium]MDA1240074.1 sodium-dependent transporter [Chloroflexota bacterium]
METWSSRTGFIFAAIGSAVGIGNIWRFSSVVGQNGGGAYLLPFFFAVFVLAVPLMVLELAAGRRLRTNLVSALRTLSPRMEVIGWLIATVVFTVLSYYLVITGWTLAFFASTATGNDLRFDEFSNGYWPVVAFAVSVLLVGVVMSLGVRQGIERISTLLMPAALVILLVLFAYATTLSGFGEGLRFLFEPDFSVLGRAELWSAALGQAFFSLSVGFGIMLTYGSYVDRQTDLVKSSAIIAVADIAVALLAGMTVFAVVFTYGLEPAAGAELAFSSLPQAFAQMPGGTVLASAFFLLLFFAALTSAVSMLELSVAALTERTRLVRRQSAALLTGAVFLLGLPSALSYSGMNLQLFGWRVLDLLDETVGSMGLPITALLIAIIVMRYLPRGWMAEELGLRPGERSVRALIEPMARWVIPLALVMVTVSRIGLGIDPAGWHQMPGVAYLGAGRQAAVTLLLVALLLAATLAVVWAARRQWPAEGDR